MRRSKRPAAVVAVRPASALPHGDKRKLELASG
jgi:hypothetical protein